MTFLPLEFLGVFESSQSVGAEGPCTQHLVCVLLATFEMKCKCCLKLKCKFRFSGVHIVSIYSCVCIHEYLINQRQLIIQEWFLRQSAVVALLEFYFCLFLPVFYISVCQY